MPKTPNSLTSTKDKNEPIKKKPGFSRLLLIVSVLVFALAGYLLSLPKVQRDDFTLNVVHRMRLPELVESIQERTEWAIQNHLSSGKLAGALRQSYDFIVRQIPPWITFSHFFKFLFLMAVLFELRTLRKVKLRPNSARMLGINDENYNRIVSIQYFLFLGCIYEISTLLADIWLSFSTPIYIDLVWIFAIFAWTGFIWLSLCNRDKFNKDEAKEKIFSKLGVTFGIFAFGGLCSDPALYKKLPVDNVVETVSRNADELLSSADNLIDDAVESFKKSKSTSTKSPIERNTVVGTIAFSDSNKIGALGDQLTHVLQTKKFGWYPLKSKYSTIHGFDGVFVKYSKNKPKQIEELVITESKVNSSKLSTTVDGSRQMSDQWVRDVCWKMQGSGDKKVKQTAKYVRDSLDGKSSAAFRKELWHVDLETGKVTINQLDKAGSVLKAKEKAYTATEELGELIVQQQIK
jgi:hypothetical protein